MTPILVPFAVLLGLTFGSFLNVVVYRLPRGESVVSPSSRCPACGATISIKDNIPIISWLVLRGRCRGCGASIRARYIVIEGVTGALWVASVFRFAKLEEATFVALAATVLVALAAIDIEHQRLPNAIVLPATAAALVWVSVVAALKGDADMIVTAIACSLAAFMLLFLIALVSGGMGMGDVKLAAFIGLVTGRFGWPVTVGAIFAAFFLGGVVAIALLAAKRAGRKSRIPFGPALAAGCVVALFAGQGPVRAWLGM